MLMPQVISPPPLRIGFIGAGANTRERHIPGFQALENVWCTVVANRSEASSREVAKAFEIPEVDNDWQAVVNHPEVDAVCIGTWPYRHAEITLAALRAGKHVLTEARMAMDLREAEMMLQASTQHPELVTQVVPAPFSLRYDRAIKAFLSGGQIGKLREIRVTHLMPAYADANSPLDWRQNEFYSGHNVLTLGILFEMVQRWMGQENPDWVQADAAVFTPMRVDPATNAPHRILLPESMSVAAGYPAARRVNLQISAITVGLPRLEAIFNGTEGTLHYDMLGQELRWASLREPQMRPVPVDPAHWGDWHVEADFVASIREGKPVTLTSFADGVRYMRFTQRVADSLTSDGIWQPW